MIKNNVTYYFKKAIKWTLKHCNNTIQKGKHIEIHKHKTHT
jgi:hypothetical protein